MEPDISSDCREDDLASTLTLAVKVYLLSSSRALRRRGLFFVNKNSCHGKKMPRPRIRDERGWFVPAEGTMARTVYDVLVAAEQCEEEFNAAVLARLLGTSTNTVRVTVCKIRGAAKSTRRSQRRAKSFQRATPQARR